MNELLKSMQERLALNESIHYIINSRQYQNIYDALRACKLQEKQRIEKENFILNIIKT